MTFNQAKAALKKHDIGSLYHIFGEEFYLRDHLLKEFYKEVVEEALKDFNYFKLDAQDFSIDVLAAAMDTFPVMAEKRLILLKDVGVFGLKFKFQKQVSQLLKSVPEHVCMIISEDNADKRCGAYKAFAKAGGIGIQCSYQAKSDLRAWIARVLRSNNKSMKSEDIDFFLECCAPGMTQIYAELEKLLNLNGDWITRDQINEVTIKSIETPLYNLTNGLSAHNPARTTQVLQLLKQNREEPIQLLYVISSHFMSLLKAKILLDDGYSKYETVKKLKLPSEYVAKKIIEQCAGMDLQYAKKCIELCKNADYEIKTGKMDGWTGVELLCAQILSQHLPQPYS